MKTTYEWDIETHDDSGDVIDHNHRERLTSFDKGELLDAMRGNRLALVRDITDAGDCLVSRAWAYTGPSGQLDDTFLNSDGLRCGGVPSRFLKEFSMATR